MKVYLNLQHFLESLNLYFYNVYKIRSKEIYDVLHKYMIQKFIIFVHHYNFGVEQKIHFIEYLIQMEIENKNSNFFL